MQQPPPWASIDDSGALLVRIKAVPGAKHNEIAGVLGEGDQARLKVRVSAPPEGGKANKAICALVADSFGVKPRDVTVVVGKTNPEKTLRIEGFDVEQLSNFVAECL